MDNVERASGGVFVPLGGIKNVVRWSGEPVELACRGGITQTAKRPDRRHSLRVYQRTTSCAGRLIRVPLEIQLKAYADAVNARLDELLPLASTIPVELHEAMR